MAIGPALADPAQPAGPPQTAASTPSASPASSPALADRQAELGHLESQIRLSDEAVARLQDDIARIGGDTEALRDQLVEAGRRVHEAEAGVLAAESRLTGLGADEDRLTASLARRRGQMIEVIAALQRMGHRPPPALLVRPEDALAAVRTAMLLGTLLPDMRQSLDALAADLSALARVRAQTVEERDRLKTTLVGLAEERTRIDLLAAERQRAVAQDRDALAAERQRGATLARAATTLRDLIGRIEGPGAPVTASLGDGGRLGPSRPFETLRGSLGLPVTGVIRTAFGQDDGLGSPSHGVTVSARSGATVTAPCDGSVVYAGPFRSYGQLLIINAGGGYHVVLAGMDRVSVGPGQFVLAGEPVATMGAGGALVGDAGTAGARTAGTGTADTGTAESRAGTGGDRSSGTTPGGTAGGVTPGESSMQGGSALYVEFRKDGTSIDPGPWWAPHSAAPFGDTGEKARG